MPVALQAHTKAFDKAMADLVAGMKKDANLEMQRQAKLLAFDIATTTPPRPKGVKGLAASIPRVKAKQWMKVVKGLVKPAYSMRVLDVARRGDTDTLWGIAKTSSRENIMKRGAINRIVKAAGKNAVLAMKNLRQILKGKMGGGDVAQVYQDLSGKALSHYYDLVNEFGQLRGKKNGKGKLGQISMSRRVYLREPITAEREKIIAAYMPTIGTVKAGWVQAGMAIPIKTARKPPNWLLGKKAIGAGTVSGSGMRVMVTLKNQKGNARGLDDRTQYVERAMRFRIRRIYNGIKGAISRQLAKKYRQLGQPVPAHLQFANRPDERGIDD